MYSRILIGYQDTEQGRDALDLGRVLAQANAAEILLPSPGEDGQGLAEVARSQGADLIVLGSTHRGPIGRVVPGSTVAHLLADAPCAIAVAPPGFAERAAARGEWHPLGGDLEDTGMRVVGVGFDGSRAAGEALKIAAELAIPNGAALRVYTVARKVAQMPGAGSPPGAPGAPTEASVLQGLLRDAIAGLPSEARALPVFKRGFPAEELIDAVNLGVDLLVLGSRGGGPIRRSFHHSVSNAVLGRAHCPVLISPAGVQAPVPT